MTSEFSVYCCVCRTGMDFNHRYGREGCCCSRDCYQEFDWRRTLSILGKPYEPDPKRLAEARKLLGE